MTFAVSLLDDSSVCQDFEVIGPYVARTDGEVIENKIIIAEPTDDSEANDFALKIVKDNIIVRNVIIYHATNAIGIYGWKPNNLTLENV